MAYINTKKDRNNLYMKLNELDTISKMKYLLTNKGFRIRYDGKWTRSVVEAVSAYETPWLHQYQAPHFECDKWHNLFFTAYGWTPTYCQNCWKVVVFIPTVEKLFDLYELQHDLEHQGKCGLEYRKTDERRYGGYFYNWGKEEGLKCYEKVRRAVDKELGEDINVILKCSCSEYEVHNGPPEEWVPSEKQLVIEEEFRRWVVMSDVKHRQTRYMVAYVMLKWLHHACHIGDLTYKAFTDGNSLVKTMKTYHDEKGVRNGEVCK